MRKTYGILVVSFIIATITTNAQTEPPPPPPPKPEEVVTFKPPVIVKEGELRPPVITVRGKMADEFYQRNPTVSEISRRANIITITKRDGTIEKYDMSKEEGDKDFTEKYGRSPIPAPPPPPGVIKPKART